MSRVYYLIKCMSLWNKIKENTINLYNRLYYFCYDIISYFNDDYNTWAFIPGGVLPISINNIKNNIEYTWLYSSTTNTLTYMDSSKQYKFAWLSAKIVIYENENTALEFDIDSFLNTLHIQTIETKLPSLTQLFITWCIYTKQWFKLTSIIEFNIIDNQGENRILTLSTHNNCFYIDNNKIYDNKN